MAHTSTLEPETETDTELRAALTALCRRYHLLAVYAFGSRAEQVASRLRGERSTHTPPQSDVDIGALPAPGPALSAKERVGLTQALEDLLNVRRVDLVILPQADPFLAANVIRGERLCALDPHAADEYDLYVLRRAGDLVPLERERIGLILGEDA